MTDWAICHGFAKAMFCISESGCVYRRNHNGLYIRVGKLSNDNSERRAALLNALRYANTSDKFRKNYASQKQAVEICKNF